MRHGYSHGYARPGRILSGFDFGDVPFGTEGVTPWASLTLTTGTSSDLSLDPNSVLQGESQIVAEIWWRKEGHPGSDEILVEGGAPAGFGVRLRGTGPGHIRVYAGGLTATSQPNSNPRPSTDVLYNGDAAEAKITTDYSGREDFWNVLHVAVDLTASTDAERVRAWLNFHEPLTFSFSGTANASIGPLTDVAPLTEFRIGRPTWQQTRIARVAFWAGAELTSEQLKTLQPPSFQPRIYTSSDTPLGVPDIDVRHNGTSFVDHGSAELTVTENNITSANIASGTAADFPPNILVPESGGPLARTFVVNDGFHQYAFDHWGQPDVVRVDDDTLVMCHIVSPFHTGDDSHLVQRVSIDNGRTWPRKFTGMGLIALEGPDDHGSGLGSQPVTAQMMMTKLSGGHYIGSCSVQRIDVAGADDLARIWQYRTAADDAAILAANWSGPTEVIRVGDQTTDPGGRFVELEFQGQRYVYSAFYYRNVLNTEYTCALARATYNPTTGAIGTFENLGDIAKNAQRRFEEPVFGVLQDGTVYVQIRDDGEVGQRYFPQYATELEAHNDTQSGTWTGNSGRGVIYRRTGTFSADGSSITWDQPIDELDPIFPGRGWPDWIQLQNGIIVAMTRGAVTPFPGHMYVSPDNGVSWAGGPFQRTAETGSNGEWGPWHAYEYGNLFEWAPNVVAVAHSQQPPAGSTDLDDVAKDGKANCEWSFVDPAWIDAQIIAAQASPGQLTFTRTDAGDGSVV